MTISEFLESILNPSVEQQNRHQLSAGRSVLFPSDEVLTGTADPILRKLLGIKGVLKINPIQGHGGFKAGIITPPPLVSRLPDPFKTPLSNKTINHAKQALEKGDLAQFIRTIRLFTEPLE